ncbi:PHP C-terminal domain protein [Sinomonas atrocyanea]|uniref:PHP C-terminal domain protein n=1 Tax=Sinomonas atrocyanea TaxID=37927 RepID=A0A127A529_9MICC|nr:PHP domain-containing protein [Sinomonas atrocyanea]AMM32732.1 PHP C-terminal domain protein [Sinomonas atrocyanea]GEB62771.1 PHP domain-containing protein [Sinomonas atrocyanea]GGG62424.1 PHP domain-containing protein [Sinomonas atrocyanea]
MDPVEALREIAFWLEREQAETYRVKAFRTAAGILAAMPPEDVAARAQNGSLRRVKGIGDRTFGVAREAVDGEVPAYLRELRDRAATPLAEGGESIRGQLRGDLHAHSDWSDGGSPLAEMAEAARWLGREYQALTDHSPTLTIARGLDAERLRRQIDAVAEVNASLGGDGFRMLTGIEVDILEDGTLDQTPELLGRLDVVVASVHSKLRSEPGPMTRRMLAAIDDPHTNVLGHCTGRLLRGSRGTRPESQFDAARVFEACAAAGVAVEINSRPERQDPPDRLIQTALDAGCLFSIDTDAHAPGQLDFLQYGAARAEANGVPAERIVTTWPLAKLLEWTSRRR